MHGKQKPQEDLRKIVGRGEEAKKVLEAQLTGGTFCPLPPRPVAACSVRLLKPSRPIN